jgi:predicted metal-dependent hydrolase
MSTNSHSITVSGIKVDIVRKDIKNLHLAVYPPDGSVRVAVPRHITNDNIRLAVVSRLAWIRRNQAQLQAQPRQTKREYVNGESHYYMGRRYRLRVHEIAGAGRVELKKLTVMDLLVSGKSTRETRHRIFTEWYRARLKEIVPTLLIKWQDKTGITVGDWRIKRMKTKWGSCNTDHCRIWLNLELEKKPVRCLEYIIVHEMTHLLEPSHNEDFITLMDKFMPHWSNYRDELNSSPVAHEDWIY